MGCQTQKGSRRMVWGHRATAPVYFWSLKASEMRRAKQRWNLAALSSLPITHSVQSHHIQDPENSREKPFSAAHQEHAAGAKRISRVARHELAGRNKGILPLYSLKDGLDPPKDLPGETSLTGNYTSHQLLLTAQWLSDQTCTWHLSGLWVIDQPYVSTPSESVNYSHLGLCFTFRLQGLKWFYF